MIDPSLAFDIAASGMAAQRANMNVIAENLANADTTSAGAPYRTRTAVFEPASLDDDETSFPIGGSFGGGSFGGEFAIDFDSDGATQDAAQGVRLADIVDDPAAAQYRFDPTNPLAAKSGTHRGYVAEPYVDPIAQMIGLITAGRAYDADVAALQGAKQMDVEADDIDRS